MTYDDGHCPTCKAIRDVYPPSGCPDAWHVDNRPPRARGISRQDATDLAIRLLPEFIRIAGVPITGRLTDAWIDQQLPDLVTAIMAAGLDRTTETRPNERMEAHSGREPYSPR